MYFLAHTSLLLDCIPKDFKEEKKLVPLVLGCWAPDFGYLSFFSWQLKKFSHTENPPTFLYKKRSKEQKLFRIGWKSHLLCDEKVHNEPFFRTKEPLCPLIVRDKSTKEMMITARKHLGREIGLDLFIYKKSLQSVWLREKQKQKKLYRIISRIPLSGIKGVCNYIYRYINYAVPILEANNLVSKSARKVVDYTFYEQKNNAQKTRELLTKTKKDLIELIEAELL